MFTTPPLLDDLLTSRGALASLIVDKKGVAHAMAKSQALKLSALKQNIDYPVANKLVDKRCLIHVKLTESCLGAIEGLMNSDKVSF